MHALVVVVAAATGVDLISHPAAQTAASEFTRAAHATRA